MSGALASGDLVSGKYRVVRLLGEGGMGAVYEAINEKLDKPVALKVLRDASPAAAERFQREAIAASRVRHPGVVEVYDADTHEGVPWIAMERLEGQSLRARIERGPLRLTEAASICGDALAALEAVHAAGLVHRDLKPDNLFLARLADGTERVKLLDFGIVVEAGPREARLTATGTTIGTPAYLAPEQAAGSGDVDARVDVYAMGVVLFEMLTGRLPYRADSLGEVVKQMYTTGPAPLVAPGVPAAVSALVATCLAVEREHRVASAAAFRRALIEATREVDALGVATTAVAPTARPEPAPPRPSRALATVASVGVLLAGFATIGWYLTHQPAAGGEPPMTPAPEPPAPAAEVLAPEQVPGDPNERIRAAVRANGWTLLGCYGSAYPGTQEDVVVGVQLVLSSTGRPSEVHISGGNAALQTCLERELGRMQFDVGPYDANFPLTLHR